MTRAEAEARRAELMPRLERLLTSLAHWRKHNKMKTNYSHEDGTAPVKVANGSGANAVGAGGLRRELPIDGLSESALDS